MIPLKAGKKENSFMQGVVWLGISTVVVKLIGVCYKIPLVRLLGTQGMGYFNAAYDVYALLCLISTTGLPVAVSVMLNRPRARQNAIFRVSLISFLVLGVLGSGAVMLLADPIAAAIGAPLAADSMRTISPALLFISLSSAFRGYFQGKGDMRPTAISQVIEALFKLLLGLVLSYLALRAGLPPHRAAACAVLGLSIATLLCTLYLFVMKKQQSEQLEGEPVRSAEILRELIMLALPITLGAALSGASKMLDLALVMRRLQDAGMSEQSAVSLYGAYSAMAIPLFGAVPALLGSLAMPLIPHLTRAIAQRDQVRQKGLLSLSFRLTALISVPSALGMSLLSCQILTLLYGARAQEAPQAAPMLILLCMAVPASCMITTTSAILQSFGKPWIPMLSMGIGCMLKALTLYVLTAMPQIGILAAPISTWLCCTVAVAVNMAAIVYLTPIKDLGGWGVAAIAASSLSIGISALIKRFILCEMPLSVTVAIIVPVAVVLFVPLALAMGLVRKDDIKSIK